MVAPSDYVYPLPDDYPAEKLAPLLCAGIIGYRSLLRAEVPPGGRLGIYGFGASAHLTAQIAIKRGATVHVLTRSEEARKLALSLGAASAGGAYDQPPEKLDSAILFAPVGDLVPTALEALDRGGTLAVAGIHLTDIPVLNYDRHLFEERSLRSVTANTRADGHAFLEFVAEHPLTVETTPYPFDQADQALRDLAADRLNGGRGSEHRSVNQAAAAAVTALSTSGLSGGYARTSRSWTCGETSHAVVHAPPVHALLPLPALNEAAIPARVTSR